MDIDSDLIVLDPSRGAGSQISPGSSGFENRCCRAPNHPQTPRKPRSLTDKPAQRVRSQLFYVTTC